MHLKENASNFTFQIETVGECLLLENARASLSGHRERYNFLFICYALLRGLEPLVIEKPHRTYGFIKNRAISACRFLKVEGSYIRVSTVLGAIILVLIIMNRAISACRFLKVEGTYMRVSTVLEAIVLV